MTYQQWWKRMEQQMREYIGTDLAGLPRAGLAVNDPVEVDMFGTWRSGTVRTLEEGRRFTWASDDGRFSAVTVDRVEFWRQPETTIPRCPKCSAPLFVDNKGTIRCSDCGAEAAPKVSAGRVA